MDHQLHSFGYMFRAPYARRLLAGVFYVIVMIMVPAAGAVDQSPAHIHRLERLIQLTHDDPARGLVFMDAHDELIAIYEATHRWQEEAWLLYALGDEVAGQRIERRLAMHLVSDAVVASRPLGRGIERVMLASGIFGVFRSVDVTDLKTGGAEDAARISALYDSRAFEPIVYRITRALGFNVVATSVWRELHGQLGVMQAFVHDLTQSGVDHRHAAYANEQMHVVDYLTQQMDRNGSNHGTRPGGHAVLWDNPAVFDAPMAQVLRRVRRENFMPEPRALRPPISLSPEAHAAVRRLKAHFALDPEHFRGFNLFLPRGLGQRIEQLLALPITCATSLR